MTLLKAVFANITIYFMSLFNISRLVALKIAKRNFCGSVVITHLVCILLHGILFALQSQKGVDMNVALLCKWL